MLPPDNHRVLRNMPESLTHTPHIDNIHTYSSACTSIHISHIHTHCSLSGFLVCLLQFLVGLFWDISPKLFVLVWDVFISTIIFFSLGGGWSQRSRRFIEEIWMIHIEINSKLNLTTLKQLHSDTTSSDQIKSNLFSTSKLYDAPSPERAYWWIID